MILHQSVLLEEVLSLLVPQADDGVMIDATLGEGGHAEAFLARHPRLILVGVDADPAILAVASERLQQFAARTVLVNEWFGTFLKGYPESAGRSLPQPDLVLMDLGISRYHYESSGRGFSFDKDEKLDMRLSAALDTTAADIVNRSSLEDISDILRSYGEERFAGRIAARIVRERVDSPIETASRLARVVAAAVPETFRHRRIHPATRTFQALRIAVNGELAQLEQGLAESLKILKPEGRVGLITFHSLEDRIVKSFFREKSKGCTCPPDWPICKCGGKRELRIVTRKPISASEEEIGRNPSSRSAKLRVAEKVAA